MTLVIGVEEEDRVILGADSAAGKPDEVYTYPALEKIVRRGPYLLGFCGSLRVGQVVHCMPDWPEPPASGELLPFLVREVVPEIRQAVLAAGAGQEGPRFLGDKTVLLVGLRGQLFIVGADLAVVRSRGWACIGSGRHGAYPVMTVLQQAGVGPARERIKRTLEVMAAFTPLVRPPWRFLEG